MKYILLAAVILSLAWYARWDVRVIQVHAGESVYLIKHDRLTGKVYRCSKEDSDPASYCRQID